MQLRPYQAELLTAIYEAWNAGAINVLAQLPTGGGKTVLFSHVVKAHIGACVVLAHRQELVAQMSLALAREGVYHRVIGTDSLRKLCVTAHVQELGRSFHDAGARCAVASVQSVSAKTLDEAWAASVTLWVMDEGHHLLAENLFGKAVAFFKRARGLLVTATPGRADGKGLGRHADGLVDVMVQGPAPWRLIEAGYLSRYRVFAPPSNFHREEIPVTASGDFSPVKLKEETKKSTVTGDVVDHYVKHALGKLGLTFADSVENAGTIAINFKAKGVRAEVLTGKTPDTLRAHILNQFRKREVMQIISVALIDEGFDCPGVEVVSDAAATESFGRFAQRFGRGLRVQEGKKEMLYFDHVGNTLRHGLPDAERPWSLNRRASRATSDSDAIPTRVCANTNVGGTGEVCAKTYERIYHACPFCGFAPVPAARTAPEFVDGDLFELDHATLAAMRGKVVDTLSSVVYLPAGVAPVSVVAQAIRNRHGERQQAQIVLRDLMALWGGWQTAQGYDERQQQRLFWHTFGVDVLGAQALGRPEAEALGLKIKAVLDNHGVISL